MSRVLDCILAKFHASREHSFRSSFVPPPLHLIVRRETDSSSRRVIIIRCRRIEFFIERHEPPTWTVVAVSRLRCVFRHVFFRMRLYSGRIFLKKCNISRINVCCGTSRKDGERERERDIFISRRFFKLSRFSLSLSLCRLFFLLARGSPRWDAARILREFSAVLLPAISMLMQFLDGLRKRSISSHSWRCQVGALACSCHPYHSSRTFLPPDCFFRPSPRRFFFFVARRGLHFGQFRRSLVHQVFCRGKVEMILPISLTDGELYLYSRLARAPFAARTSFPRTLIFMSDSVERVVDRHETSSIGGSRLNETRIVSLPGRLSSGNNYRHYRELPCHARGSLSRAGAGSSLAISRRGALRFERITSCFSAGALFTELRQ